MKSKTQSTSSTEAREKQSTDSVFDFLYHDGRRVASLLAQFDPSGSITQISQGTHAERVRVDSQKIEGQAQIVGLAKGALVSSDELRNRRQDDILTVYDPMWANARALLDILDERGLIQRDTKRAGIGQIVLVSGKLDIYDLQIMSGFWKSPTVKKLIASGVPQHPQVPREIERTPAGKALKKKYDDALKETRSGMDLFMDLAPNLPHASHGALVSGDNNFWFSIDQSGLSMTTADIMLKHGIAVPGVWAVLGILDAVPEPIELRNRPQTPDGEEMVAKVFEAIAPMIRTFFGRPTNSFGVTPLLIFRELASSGGIAQS